MTKSILGVMILALMLGCTATTAPEDPKEVKNQLLGTWKLMSRAAVYPASDNEKRDLAFAGLAFRFASNDTVYFIENDTVYFADRYTITRKTSTYDDEYPWRISLGEPWMHLNMYALSSASLVIKFDTQGSEFEYYRRQQ